MDSSQEKPPAVLCRQATSEPFLIITSMFGTCYAGRALPRRSWVVKIRVFIALLFLGVADCQPFPYGEFLIQSVSRPELCLMAATPYPKGDFCWGITQALCSELVASPKAQNTSLFLWSRNLPCSLPRLCAWDSLASRGPGAEAVHATSIARTSCFVVVFRLPAYRALRGQSID